MSTKSLEIILISVCILSYFKESLGNEPWNYEENGPDKWIYLNYPSCGGSSQSPIDIPLSQVNLNPELVAFKLAAYNKTYKYIAEFNGHSVQLSVPDETEIIISGSNLNDTAELLQVHFHFGQNEYQGSEHRLDGRKYPMEMHCVHMSRKNQIRVLGFFFQLDDKDNEKLTSLTNVVSQLKNISESIELDFNLYSILPGENELKSYLRYEGSLTTPPCTENVLWSVFHFPINISLNQLNSFKANGLSLNFREPQNLNCRKVESSFTVKPTNPICNNKAFMLSHSSFNSHILILFIFYSYFYLF